MIKPQKDFFNESSVSSQSFHKQDKSSRARGFFLKHFFLGVFGLTMVAACASSEQGSKVSEPTSATIGNPAVAQSSAQFTDPKNLPFLELKPATQRQKDILSQMPDSDYRAIPKELIRVAEADLNNDGIAEFIATYEPPTLGYCGNRGCPMAIYSNQGGSWRIIYGVLGYGGIKIENSMTDGFKDLLIPVNSNNQIFHVLTFKSNEYTLTHFQHGNNRFNAIDRREVYLSKPPVFYSQPSTSFPVSVFFSSEEPIVLEAKTNDWYLIRPCTSYACSGTFVYIPVEVVDGRSSGTNSSIASSSQETNYTTHRFESTVVANTPTNNITRNFEISYPADY